MADEDRDADVLDEHFLRGRGAALHAVEHDDVGAGFHGKSHVIVGTRRADLHVDRLLPIGDLAQFLQLDLEIVGAGPVGMTAGGALVDAFWQIAHLGDAIRNLLAQQHAAAAGLGALADDDFDGVRLAQVVGVHAVARWQVLIDQRLGLAALFRRHAAVAGGRRGAGDRRRRGRGRPWRWRKARRSSCRRW